MTRLRIHPASTLAILLLCTACLTFGCMASGNSPDVMLEKANMLSDRGQFEDAVPVYSKALETFKDRADVFYRRGVCYENLNLFDRALADYTSALDVDPMFSDAINNKGVVLAKMERFEDAAKEFTLLVNQFPDNVLALRNRGLCWHDLSRFNEAIADYERALQLDPKDPESWFQRGNVRLEQEEYDQAVADYDKAIELDEAFAKAWMNRGVARYHLNQKQEAVVDLRHARSLNDNIVIPGIDWAEAAPSPVATDIVVAAKPVMLAEESTGWTACEAFAKQYLLAEGYSEISIAAVFEDRRCGIIHAEKEDSQIHIYVGFSTDEEQAISLPAIARIEGDTTQALLILEAEKTEEESVAVQLAKFTESWEPDVAAMTPVLVELAQKDD